MIRTFNIKCLNCNHILVVQINLERSGRQEIKCERCFGTSVIRWRLGYEVQRYEQILDGDEIPRENDKLFFEDIQGVIE